jgi:hypothetical protein
MAMNRRTSVVLGACLSFLLVGGGVFYAKRSRPQRAAQPTPAAPVYPIPTTSLEINTSEREFARARTTGEVRALDMVNDAIEKAKADPGVDRKYLAKLHMLKAEYESRIKARREAPDVPTLSP